MTIKALEGKRYKVDIRPNGRAGRRIQRIFNKRADAVAFERYVLVTADREEWQPQTRDFRRLSELLEIWWNYTGRNLTWGKKKRTALVRIIKEMGNPVIYKMTPRFLNAHCSDRLYEGVKPATVNRDMAVLMGMFTVLINVNEFSGKNPIKEVPRLKEKKVEMTYLTKSQISRLLTTATGDDWRISVLCLSTGARWGEATKLRAEYVRHGRVTFTQTKNGKPRTVPISEKVMNAIKIRETGLLFDVNYVDYRKMLKAANPDLPYGQAVHVLRHTFAAHFMMNGGNILTLQKIMGHASIQQTMTYAHLAPDYLQEAINLNPLQGDIHILST